MHGEIEEVFSRTIDRSVQCRVATTLDVDGSTSTGQETSERGQWQSLASARRQSGCTLSIGKALNTRANPRDAVRGQERLPTLIAQKKPPVAERQQRAGSDARFARGSVLHFEETSPRTSEPLHPREGSKASTLAFRLKQTAFRGIGLSDVILNIEEYCIPMHVETLSRIKSRTFFIHTGRNIHICMQMRQ